MINDSEKCTGCFGHVGHRAQEDRPLDAHSPAIQKNSNRPEDARTPVRKFSTVRKTYALIASCPRNVVSTVPTLYGSNRRRRRQSLLRGNQPDPRLRAISTSSDRVLFFGIPTRSARPRQESTDVWEKGFCCCSFALRESCRRRRRRSKAGCCQAAAIQKLRE